MKRFLIVDDDPELRANISEILQAEGYEVSEASTGEEAIKKSVSGDFDIILLDHVMPGMNGLDALIELRKVSPKAKVLMITAFSTIGNAVEAIKKGASDYIAKPFKIDVLMTAIRRIIEEARFEENLKELDLDFTLSSLSNPIRRNILIYLEQNSRMRLMEICRKLEIEDHTKVVFHLKNLKENGIISQNEDKSYSLTREGNKTLLSLKAFTRQISGE